MPGWVGQLLLKASALLTIGSIVAVFLLLPDGVIISSDPGAPTMANWAIVLPSALGFLLTLALPRRSLPMPAIAVRRDRLLLTTGLLLLLSTAFTLATILLPLDGEDYILGKFLLLMLVPAGLLHLLRNSMEVKSRSAAWRWWAPLVVIGVWFYLSQLAPWNPRYDPGEIDPTYLIIAALATAITAGVGEELFFRRWLQTRLEAVLGAWAGIGVTSVLFGLMHVGSHGAGDGLLDTARVIMAQGTFGWFLGAMWWRYRNLTMIILVHLIANGWGVVAYFFTQS